ncbi:hypothetical protein AQJ67_28440 [Streptomyces caeruleatus]|uniref:Integral membrane protein n=2 Tax=Streptomyces caeruleatus TaxID=661399 RepID=A0A101TTM9_9ACTN|nr:hypothetical protein [Streptomyces caeruleatus]KUN98274.1 hypothetical protein AQJ67_28440 [Streptomyces caeruleatus]
MQGHGYTQPVKQPPPTGWLVFLRVFFVVISVLSFGLLTWTMMLRLAIVTRKPLDWVLFAASIVVEFGGLIMMGMEPGDEIHTAGGWTGLALVLGGIVAAIAYYLSADIRHFHPLRYPGYGPQRPPVAAPAYGYPQPPSPYTTTTAPQTPPPPRTPAPHTPIPSTPIPSTPAPRDAAPHTPAPRTPAPHTPVPPPPQRPAPARIDQVRAELDELSDYLRQHDGRQDGNHEGGR